MFTVQEAAGGPEPAGRHGEQALAAAGIRHPILDLPAHSHYTN
jgi:hypothetical protein